MNPWERDWSSAASKGAKPWERDWQAKPPEAAPQPSVEATPVADAGVLAPLERFLAGAGRMLANSPKENVGDLGSGVGLGLVDVAAPFESSDTAAAQRQAIFDVTGGKPGLLQSGGQLATQIGAMMGVGGGLGAIAGKAGAPMLANALRTGGWGQDMNALTRLAGGLPTNALGGAMMMPDDPLTGAAGMTAAGFAAPYVLPWAAQMGGKAYDWAKGRTADVAAGRITREAAGNNLQAILDAAHAAPPNLTATQAAAGINQPQFFALGEDALKYAPGEAGAILDAQAAERVNALARLAGGDTATGGRASRESAKQTLNALADPMRSGAIEGANVGGKTLSVYERQAAEAAAAATSAVDDVKRFEAAKGRTREVFGANPEGFFPGTPPGTPSTGYQNSYMSQLAQKAEQAAAGAADDSLAAGGLRRGAEAKAQAIRDMGFQPLDTSKLTGHLRGQANAPGVRADPAQAAILSDLADHIDELSRINGGVIDAEDLYQLRKTGVNDIITRKLSVGGMNPKAQDKRIAELLVPIKAEIDDAITAAGGKDWSDYLKTYSSGMQTINQQKLAGEALKRMQQESPDAFLKLVNGNDPKAVEKIFGPGSYDIAKEMGAKMAPLNKAASELARDKTVAEQAARGQTKLGEILVKDRNWVARLASKLTSIGTGASPDAVVNAMEEALSNKTKDALAKGFLSGANLTELVGQMPTAERAKVAKLLSGLGRPVTTAVTTNALANRNDNALRSE